MKKYDVVENLYETSSMSIEVTGADWYGQYVVVAKDLTFKEARAFKLRWLRQQRDAISRAIRDTDIEREE